MEENKSVKGGTRMWGKEKRKIRPAKFEKDKHCEGCSLTVRKGWCHNNVIRAAEWTQPRKRDGGNNPMESGPFAWNPLSFDSFLFSLFYSNRGIIMLSSLGKPLQLILISCSKCFFGFFLSSSTFWEQNPLACCDKKHPSLWNTVLLLIITMS